MIPSLLSQSLYIAIYSAIFWLDASLRKGVFNSLRFDAVIDRNSGAVKRLIIASAIFVVWFIAIAVAFWWFQLRYINDFGSYFAEFNGESIEASFPFPVSGDAVVVHILDDGCPCTRFAHDHIRELEHRFSSHVVFMNWRELPESFRSSVNLPASPAVAIWDGTGALAYFGPYSSGSFCGQGDDFVFATLDNLTNDVNPKWINQDAVGCFCPWGE